MNTYIVTPKHLIPQFVHQHDRHYFSKPVLVVPLYCDVRTRLVYVRDDARGGIVFPCLAASLVAEHRLTTEQRRLIA